MPTKKDNQTTDNKPQGESKKKPTPSKQTGKLLASPAETEKIKRRHHSDAGVFPIVGIGASAGGLEAFEKFFTGMPANVESGMAFVLVQHLDPDHKSILVDLLKRYTRMKVYEVEDGVKIKPNCAYIIPPNRDMALLHGKLHLIEPDSPRGLRLPIDFFFRSLAQDQHERAICIILAGTGTDGTLGLKAIKGEGGMAMVQEPDSARYDGMPRSAIQTGLVDYILPPDKMPAQLLAYAEHAFGKRTKKIAPPVPKTGDSLQKIFILLRAQTGHDFSYYKQNTIRRRIERRIAVNQIEQIEHYVRYLQQNPLEVEILFRDMLIGVTNFFRDPEAFETLSVAVLPALFEKKSMGDSLRIWVPGCSTGEEAFSLAILLREFMDKAKQDFKVQIFATDIDSEAIEKARTGLYLDNIAADISPERLIRFFNRDQDSNTYRIKKTIRDMVVFAEQNVIEDPPFSKLDLISCRNLLIYMGPELQKKVVPLFHYALNPEGFLFLGSSETIGEFIDLFGVVDRKWKLYRGKGDISPRLALRDFSAVSLPDDVRSIPVVKRGEQEVRINMRELVERNLLINYAPASAVINEKGEALYIHGRTGKYLEPASGEASLNILRMAREGLRLELTAAIRKAVVQKEAISYTNLQVRGNGSFYTINLTVSPVTKPASMQGLLMVVFEDVTPAKKLEGRRVSKIVTDKEQRIINLERELKSKEEHLQTTIEELETSNEELKSTNEELQSTNEELQSTNEELETSKEELQSVNEELVTVNMELQKKVDELSRTNNDMNNLMAGTGVGTIFVDHQLRIQRFTPSATQVINLIQPDIGRPIGHIVSNLVGYNRLIEDTQSVLDSLIPKEAEVQTTDGQWFLMRILPYRTVENVIEGAVLTFVEMTGQKRMQTKIFEVSQQAQNERDKLRALVDSIADEVWFCDANGKFSLINVAAVKEFGFERAEEMYQLVPEWLLKLEVYTVDGDPRREEDAPLLRSLQGETIKGLEEIVRHPISGKMLHRQVTSAPLVAQTGEITGAVAVVRDITERKRLEQQQRLATIVRDSSDAITVQDFEGAILAWNPGAERMYGWNEAEAITMNIRDIVPDDKRDEALAFIKQLAEGKVVEAFRTQRIVKGGQVVNVWLVASLLVDEAGQPYAVSTTERNMLGDAT